MNDLTGMTIPTHLEALWNRREEVQDTIRHIQVLRKSIASAWQDDPLYIGVSLANIASKLEAVYRDLLCAVPYAVCPTCQGEAVNACLLCKKRGFLSKLQWQVCVPEEMKEIRKAMKC